MGELRQFTPPSEARGPQEGAAFSGRDGSQVARASHVRDVDAVRPPAPIRPGVRSIDAVPSRVESTRGAVLSPDVAQSVAKVTEAGKLQVVMPEPEVNHGGDVENVQTPDSLAEKSDSTTSNGGKVWEEKSRARQVVERGVIAGAAATSLAACGSDGGPSNAPDTDLSGYSAACYRDTIPEGETRITVAIRDQTPTPGAEENAFIESVRTINNERQSFLGSIFGSDNMSTDTNELGSVTWRCQPGTSIYETVPGTNRQYVNPEAVAQQDKHALE